MKCAIYICKGSQRSGGSRTKSKHRRLLHKSSDCLLAVCITCRFTTTKKQGNWIFKKTSEGLRQDEKIFLAHIREAIFDLVVKWRLILARIFLLDTFWVSALLIFSNEKKRGFCQPGPFMKFYICRWFSHLPVFFFLSVLDGRALKKNTLHYQIWITKFQFDWTHKKHIKYTTSHQ